MGTLVWWPPFFSRRCGPGSTSRLSLPQRRLSAEKVARPRELGQSPALSEAVTVPEHRRWSMEPENPLPGMRLRNYRGRRTFCWCWTVPLLPLPVVAQHDAGSPGTPDVRTEVIRAFKRIGADSNLVESPGTAATERLPCSLICNSASIFSRSVGNCRVPPFVVKRGSRCLKLRFPGENASGTARFPPKPQACSSRRGSA
jgi:hypothetical protein